MSDDYMPCGCLGHADNADLCEYPALLAERNELGAQLREAQERAEKLTMRYAESESWRRTYAEDARRLAKQLEAAETTPLSAVAAESAVVNENNEALGLKILDLESEPRIEAETLELAAKELGSHCVLRKPWPGGHMPYHDSCPDCRAARIVRALATRKEKDGNA